MKHFWTWVFYVWACTFFFSFIVTCIHLRCYVTSDVHFIICVFLEKEKIKRFSEPKKEGYNILLNVLLVYFSFWLKNYFDMCFDHLIKVYVSHDHYYSTSHMIINHLYLYKHVLNVMTIYFQKEKKLKHLNSIYSSNDLNKMKQKRNLSLQLIETLRIIINIPKRG